MATTSSARENGAFERRFFYYYLFWLLSSGKLSFLRPEEKPPGCRGECLLFFLSFWLDDEFPYRSVVIRKIILDPFFFFLFSSYTMHAQ